MYGIDTWDSRLYDMVINISTLTIDDIVEIISMVVQKPTFKSTLESRKIATDKAILSRKQAYTIQSMSSSLF